MILKILNTGSQGNCYVLDGKEESLVIEAGVKPKKVFRAVDYNPLKVTGLIVSHEHADHNRYEKAMQYELFGDALGSGDILKSKSHFTYNRYEVTHDVTNFAYLINHPEIGSLFYLTDAAYIPVKLKGINHLLIECNYSEEILDHNVMQGKVNGWLAKRIRENHLSIERLEHWLTQIDISQLKTITVCHLSSDNSNEYEFRERIEQLTRVTTYIAAQNKTINLCEN